MAIIILESVINAPLKSCFNLSRSIDLHVKSMEESNEKAIAGTTTGLIKLGETVTWKAKHLGLFFTMTSKISSMETPYFFVDEMIKGPFKKLHHQHRFKHENGKTIMTDIFEFKSPCGFFGKIIDRIFLKKYLMKLLVERNRIIKREAEYN